MTNPARKLLILAAVVTLPALAWYAIAWMTGNLHQANYAMLALLGSTVLWTGALYQILVAAPIEAWIKRVHAGQA